MPRSQLSRVALWMTGELLSFSGTALAIRALGYQLNIFEILTIRAALGLVALLAIIAVRPELRPEMAPTFMRLHLGRNVPHFIGQYCWALAITMLPFATVFSLEFTMPAWVAVLAAIVLNEKMTRSRVGSIILGFIGVVVIVRPGMASFQPAALLVLFAAFAYAISLIITKQLTNRVSAFAIIFWMNAIQLPLALAYPLFQSVAGGPSLFVFRMGSDLVIPTIVLGITGLTSHYCLSQAFRYGDATVVVPVDFLRMPLIAVVGWLFYGEGVDSYVFFGAVLIMTGIVWNLRAESIRSRRLATRVEPARTAGP